MSAKVVMAQYSGDAKKCPRCEAILPVEAFGLVRQTRAHHVYIRRQSYCRECHRIRGREAHAEKRRRAPRKPFAKRHLRLVKSADRDLPVHAPERTRVPLESSLAVCVCGAMQAEHANGKGACAATGCPEWMERGL